MAEPTRFTSLEADAGGLPTFTTPSSIFDIPNTLLGGFPIGADSSAGAFFQSPGSFLPSSLNLTPATTVGDIILPDNVFAGKPIFQWSDYPQGPAPDLSGITLQQQPFNNIPVGGIIQTNVPNVAVSAPTTPTGESVTTNYAGAGDVTTLPTYTVTAGPVTPQTMTGQIYQPIIPLGGGAGIGGAVSEAAMGGTTLVMDPFQVSTSKLPSATLTFGGQQTEQTPTGAATGEGGATTLPTMTVSGSRVQTPTMSTPDMMNLLNRATTAWGTQPVTLPPVTAETTGPTVNPLPVTTSVPTITPPPLSVTVPPQVTVPATTTTTPPPSTVTPTTTGTAPTGGGTTTATPTTTTTSSAMNQRDLKAELEKTMAAFNEYRPQIQQMYGDLYQQFMPKGLTAAEPGIINQYQADLARLQQRQAGMLSPEDVRQSQQSAREAYGARGQVMGPGAIGAEILNREAIRQQREDQARAALQSSYGNVLNMANLQTGNLFSPIASLMSSTFNPLGAYPADVYGTNVNAQLARDIAQKNYEAAIRSAELQGSAAKSAANTSLFGDFFKTAVGVKVYVNCMPGDQVIDTPAGAVAVESIKGGDEVIGYDGSVAKVLQVCSYVQDADKEFFTFHLSNGGKITVCERHKIMDIPASEWVVGATMGDAIIERIERKSGITTSYDLVTEVSGYRIAGVPVNSMIPEMLALTLQLVALKQIA